MTYKHFRQKLDQHSVFAGRNVLVRLYSWSTAVNLVNTSSRHFLQELAGNALATTADSTLFMDTEDEGKKIPLARLNVQGISLMYFANLFPDHSQLSTCNTKDWGTWLYSTPKISIKHATGLL